MNKEQVANVLVEIGVLLELKGENPFKTRAYVNAARTLEGLTEPLGKLVEEERLGDIKGIGDALQQKITELVTTGKLKYYDDLKASVPPGLVEMLGIPGVGPKKVKALHDKLGIESIEQLEMCFRVEERLLVSLSVNVYQERTQVAQQRVCCELVVDEDLVSTG